MGQLIRRLGQSAIFHIYYFYFYYTLHLNKIRRQRFDAIRALIKKSHKKDPTKFADIDYYIRLWYYLEKTLHFCTQVVFDLLREFAVMFTFLIIGCMFIFAMITPIMLILYVYLFATTILNSLIRFGSNCAAVFIKNFKLKPHKKFTMLIRKNNILAKFFAFLKLVTPIYSTLVYGIVGLNPEYSKVCLSLKILMVINNYLGLISEMQKLRVLWPQAHDNREHKQLWGNSDHLMFPNIMRVCQFDFTLQDWLYFDRMMFFRDGVLRSMLGGRVIISDWDKKKFTLCPPNTRGIRPYDEKKFQIFKLAIHQYRLSLLNSLASLIFYYAVETMPHCYMGVKNYILNLTPQRHEGRGTPSTINMSRFMNKWPVLWAWPSNPIELWLNLLDITIFHTCCLAFLLFLFQPYTILLYDRMSFPVQVYTTVFVEKIFEILDGWMGHNSEPSHGIWNPYIHEFLNNCIEQMQNSKFEEGNLKGKVNFHYILPTAYSKRMHLVIMQYVRMFAIKRDLPKLKPRYLREKLEICGSSEIIVID